MSKITGIDGGGIAGYVAETVVAVTAGATPAIDATKGGVFTLTPGEDETISISGGVNGESIALVVTSVGTTSRTLTFGTGFKTTGTLATGTTAAKTFVVRFLCVGGTFLETSRTTAM